MKGPMKESITTAFLKLGDLLDSIDSNDTGIRRLSKI